MPQETCGFCEFAVKNQYSHRCSFSKHCRTIISDQIISELISSSFFTSWSHNMASVCSSLIVSDHSMFYSTKIATALTFQFKKHDDRHAFFHYSGNQQKCKSPRIQYFTNLQISVPCFAPVSLGWSLMMPIKPHETLHASRLGRSLFLASWKIPKCTKAFIQKPTLLKEVVWGCEYDIGHFKTKLMKNNEKNEETSHLSMFFPFSLKPVYPRNLFKYPEQQNSPPWN